MAFSANGPNRNVMGCLTAASVSVTLFAVGDDKYVLVTPFANDIPLLDGLNWFLKIFDELP